MLKHPLIPVFFICALTCSCSHSKVEPWQKQDLARPDMQINSNAIDAVFEEHFYFSKEGSAGGRGFSGGGCGCN